jgi:hypothetical protein
MIAIYNNKKFGFMDRTGQTIIEIQFERQSLPSFGLVCAKFSEGLAAVKTDGKHCLIDKSGNAFAIKDKVCGHDVVRNSKGEITWPRNIKELCGK